MYFSDRPHKFNQSTLPAEDTAMAQGAEQGSLEVTATSSQGHQGQAEQDSQAGAELWVQGSRSSSHTDLPPAHPRSFLSYPTARTIRKREGRHKCCYSVWPELTWKDIKELTWKPQRKSGPSPFRRARADVKHSLLVKHSFRFHLFLHWKRSDIFYGHKNILQLTIII